MVEQCSGLRGAYGAVSWFVVPAVASFPNRDGSSVSGYYSAPGHQVVLAEGAVEDGSVVRHEMLHALLGHVKGHPRGQFLDRCGGVVDCQDACVQDAGPAADPPAGTVSAPASALRLAAEVTPNSPSASTDGGRFTLTVTATNTRPTPIVIDTRAGFGYRVDPDTTLSTTPPSPIPSSQRRTVLVYDVSTIRFTAGETKRFLFDFRVDGAPTAGAPVEGAGAVVPNALLPGRYQLRGSFSSLDGGPRSPVLSLVLLP